MDSNRRFNNELAAFKEGKTVQHEEIEIVKIPNSQKKSIVKLTLILFILFILGYFLIKIPFFKQNLSANTENIEQKLSLKLYKAEISQRFPNWSISDELINDLYLNSVSIRAISLMHSAKNDEVVSLKSYNFMEHFLEQSNETRDSLIVHFLVRFDAEKLILINEAGIDLEELNEINRNELFQKYTFDDLTLLASTDSQNLIKYFSKNNYTQQLTHLDWLLIAEKRVNPTLVNTLSESMGDFSKKLTIEELAQLSEKQIKPDVIIQALKSSSNNEIDNLLNQN